MIWDGAAKLWAGLPSGLRIRVLRASNHKVTLGVVGLVHDGAGRVLVLDHRFRPRWTWGLPGGFLEPREPMVEGLVRELREETHLEVEVDPAPYDVEHLVAPGAVTVTFVARTIDPAPTLRLSPELRGGGFYAPHALPEGVYPHHQALIRRWASAAQRR